MHLAADALGSLSVLASSLLINLYGFYLADPICSALLALAILSAAIPLVFRSVELLLHKLPKPLQVTDGDLTKSSSY